MTSDDDTKEALMEVNWDWERKFQHNEDFYWVSVKEWKKYWKEKEI